MSKRTWLPARSRLAFTLVELMVVITIIAVLAAILLPAIGNVMRYADNLQCRNNLKQIAMSVLSYTTDYQGAIPPTMVKRGNKIYYWCNLLAMRDLAGENTAGKTDAGGQPARTSQNTVLLCPSSSLDYVEENNSFDKPDDDLAQGWYRVGNTEFATDCSYYWNGYTGTDPDLKERIPSLYVDETTGNPRESYHNIAEIPQRSHLAMVMDGVFWLNYGNDLRPQRIAARHYGEHGSRFLTNIAFYDAHVEAFDRYAPGRLGHRTWTEEEVVEEMHLPEEKRHKKPIMNPEFRGEDLEGGPPYFLLPKR